MGVVLDSSTTFTALKNIPKWSKDVVRLINAVHAYRRPFEFPYAQQSMQVSLLPSQYKHDLELVYDLRMADGIAKLSMDRATLEALMAHIPNSVALHDTDAGLQAIWLEYAFREVLTVIERYIGGPVRLDAPKGAFARVNEYHLVLRLSNGSDLYDVALSLDANCARRLLSLIQRGWPRGQRRFDELPLLVRHCAGSQHLTLEEFASLHPGDIVMLEQMHASDTLELNGHVLALMNGTPPTLSTPLNFHYSRDVFMSDDTDNQHVNAPQSERGELDNLNQLPLRLTAELGHLELSLGELRSLGEGSVLPIESPLDDSVVLRINGKEIGGGRLVQLGDRLGVQITRIIDDA